MGRTGLCHRGLNRLGDSPQPSTFSHLAILRQIPASVPPLLPLWSLCYMISWSLWFGIISFPESKNMIELLIWRFFSFPKANRRTAQPMERAAADSRSSSSTAAVQATNDDAAASKLCGFVTPLTSFPSIPSNSKNITKFTILVRFFVMISISSTRWSRWFQS